MKRLAKIGTKRIELPQGVKLQWQRRPGGWWIGEIWEKDRLVKRIRIAHAEERGKFWTQLSGTHFSGEWIEESRGSSSTLTEGDLTAQFPGKVRKILVSVGQAVAEGDPLVLIEAMKMEFSIKAPYAGQVKRLCVKEGQQLQPGLQLVELEKSGK